MPSMTSETSNGNGHSHDHRAERDPRESLGERLERVQLEQSEHLGNLARDGAMNRQSIDRLTANVEVIRHEQQRQGETQTAQSSRLDSLAADVRGIAKAVGAKRTYSGELRVSVPPSEPMHVRASPSPTGSHFRIDPEEIERLSRAFAEKEAEERGAREALEEARREALDIEAKAKAARERTHLVLACLGLALTIASLLGASHVSFH